MKEPTYHLCQVIRDKDAEPEDFSGPLDVILLLLSKNKIEIRDIQISEILEQYLSYLEEMKHMDLEIASAFIIMASHLTLIKTKMLLSEAEQQEGRSEMELLIQTLENRQEKDILEKIKVPAALLDKRSEFGCCLFIRQPEPVSKDTAYRYQHDRNDLWRTFQNLQDLNMQHIPSPTSALVGIAGREPYPVEKKTAEILKILITRGTQPLQKLLSSSSTKSELVAAFLSILELCRLHSVRIIEVECDVSICYIQMPEGNVNYGSE